MKNLKWFIVAFFLIVFVYLALLGTQMSTVYKPLRTYQFGLSENKLHQRLIEISKLRSDLTITFADSIGKEMDGIDYHCNLDFKSATNEYAFYFIYKGSLKNERFRSEIELISATDYGLKTKIQDIDHEYASRLIEIFEIEFVDNLNIQQ